MIVNRTDAGLKIPLKGIEPAPIGRNHLFVHHTVTDASSDAKADWRKVQAVAFGRGFKDISYTWGIHPDGTCLEGRYPGSEGAHTEGWNRSAHGVVFIGNYQERQVTQPQIEAFRWLRQEIVRMGCLSPAHTIRPHSAVKQTACPGAGVQARWHELTAIVVPPEEAALKVPRYFTTLVAPNGGWWHATTDGGVFTSPNQDGSEEAPFYGSIPGLGGLPAGAHVVGFVPHRGGYAFIVRHTASGYEDEITAYHFPAG